MTPLPAQPDSYTEDIFDCILQPVTDSVVKPIVRRKLHVSLRPDDTSRENQDALELIGDVQVALLVELSDNRSANDKEIRDFKSYAAVVTTNACYQYFRSKYPIRTQQKNKIRYFLTHSGRFATWTDKCSGKRVCGYAYWEMAGRQMVGLSPGWDAELPPGAFQGRNERDVLSSITETLFEEIGGPVSLDELTTFVMAKRGLRERVDIPQHEHLSGDTSSSPGFNRKSPVDDVMDGVEELKQLWKGVLQLTLNHRRALLLNLKDSHGHGLISVLPASGTASISEIADALDFPMVRFAEIWNTLPWCDNAIAEHMRLTRQQVINLRQSARARLARLCSLWRQY